MDYVKAHHLKSLIRYVEQGGKLRCHEDVPGHIRQELYNDDLKQLEKRQKAPPPSTPSCPPINITNVLPTQSPRSVQQAIFDETPPQQC